MDNINYWNDIYSNIKDKKITYDLWLDKHADILKTSKDFPIIDLGCGSGSDTLYLVERGYSVLSCDYSNEALEIVKKFILNSNILRLDITKKLPFEDESVIIIIADLSLHYFDDKITKDIVKEIRRVLKKDGHLIGRVNSINDINYGFGTGEKIEENFYLTDVGYKRFFDKEAIYNYFNDFEIKFCKEEVMNRYGSEKKAFEFVVKK